MVNSFSCWKGRHPFSALLSEMVLRLNENPIPDILYGRRPPFGGWKDPFGPILQAGLVAELLRITNYLRHALFRQPDEPRLQAHSGEEIGYDELIFRCVEAARGIGHIPKVLYHYKVGVSSDLRQARLKSIDGHLQRTGVSGAQAAILKNSQVSHLACSASFDHHPHTRSCRNPFKFIQTLRERTSYQTTS